MWLGHYLYVMDKTIMFRFSTPDPLKYEVKVAGKNIVKRRNWDGDKLLAYLQEQLPGVFEGRFPEYGLRIEMAKKRDIVLEGWKPDKEEGDEIKEAFDGLVGEVLEDIEVEDFLLD